MFFPSILAKYKKQKRAMKNLTPFAREFMSFKYNNLFTTKSN